MSTSLQIHWDRHTRRHSKPTTVTVIQEGEIIEIRDERV